LHVQPHWPDEQVAVEFGTPLEHATGAPQAPPSSQVSIAAASAPAVVHSVAPGLHATHAPFAQVPLPHGTGDPHDPASVQDSTLFPFAQVVDGGRQDTHWPLRQLFPGQPKGAPHCPLAWHVSTPPLAHCVSFGLQTPVQPPSRHT
jgi:hypothetical protein